MANKNDALVEEIKEEVLQEIKKEKHKKRKFWNSVYEIFDTLAMAVFATGGILLSKYIPMFRNDEYIEFTIPEWGRLVIAFALAFGIVAATEISGDTKGKKKNFAKRAYSSFASGLMWYTILGF